MNYNFGLTIESLVAILLFMTIIYCAKLNSRLGKLRADEQTMKTTITELMTATATAERAIAGLKLTISECEQNLDTRLRDAEIFTLAIGENLKAGEDVLARLRKIAYARKLFESADGHSEAEPQSRVAPPVAPQQRVAPDTNALVAAAQAFADRARSRVSGLAA